MSVDGGAKGATESVHSFVTFFIWMDSLRGFQKHFWDSFEKEGFKIEIRPDLRFLEFYG